MNKSKIKSPLLSVSPFAIAPLLFVFGACSASTADSFRGDSIEECDAYAAAFRACHGGTGSAADVVVDRHLRVLAAQESVSDDAGRESVRASCVSRLRSLREACR